MSLLNAATRDYAKAVAEMIERIEAIPELEYRRIRAKVELARVDAEHARESLIAHRKSHEC